MVAPVARQMVARAERPAVSAAVPILASKITAPGVRDWAVQRPRVSQLITRATRWCPLTVVTGPQGAGKTMALALWAAAESGRVAWVCPDSYDDRPEVFWAYVVAALQRSGVAIPGELPAAARGGSADYRFLLRIASLLADQDPPVILILDDFHVLSESEVMKGLNFVLRNAGAGLRLVACSRMEPLLPLHRYRLAGHLAEIRAGDLAFSTAEADLLMAQHGVTLRADSLESLMQRTEGWAAGLRLAAMSMGAHPDPDQFVKELASEDSALTSYLVDEILNTQPPDVRDILLGTSILEEVDAEAACEVTGNEHAAEILSALAHANAFIQPTGCGRYRYHSLFAEVLRLKLRHGQPGRTVALHRRAARWYERNGPLTEAVRHAAKAGDWPLAASIVIEGLAISEIIEPWSDQLLSDEFRNMPQDEAWGEPQPYLASAAVAVSAGQPEGSAAALSVAEDLLERLPADQQAAGLLAATMIHLAISRRTGDLAAAAVAADQAELLVGKIPGHQLALHPEIRARVLAVRGTVELWAGHLGEAARILASAADAAAASGSERGRADCIGRLALVAALRGQLTHAAKLASPPIAGLPTDKRQPPARNPNPMALVALALVHLEHMELRPARDLLRQADAGPSGTLDRPVQVISRLIMACSALAEGRAGAAIEIVATARSGRPAPAWLDHKLSLVESRAHVATGDIRAALTAARLAAGDNSPASAVTLAHAWAAAGDRENARRALTPALATQGQVPEQVRLQAHLVNAWLCYKSGDHALGRQSLASALRLAEHEQLRLPFAMEYRWIAPVLRRDPELAAIHHRLLPSSFRRDRPPGPAPAPASATRSNQASTLIVEPLTGREREVLRHASAMLSTAEIASELYISANTVKTHLRTIYRKLAASQRSEAVRRARQLGLL
jgi:LuxR family transcriptional regulator, maltose regulon positive regulatory protein